MTSTLHSRPAWGASVASPLHGIAMTVCDWGEDSPARALTRLLSKEALEALAAQVTAQPIPQRSPAEWIGVFVAALQAFLNSPRPYESVEHNPTFLALNTVLIQADAARHHITWMFGSGELRDSRGAVHKFKFTPQPIEEETLPCPPTSDREDRLW